MNKNSFLLSSRDEVIRFESLINSYENKTNGFNFNNLSLISAYDYCQNIDNGSKLFAAFLDTYLNILLLSLDIKSTGASWNDQPNKNAQETAIFDDARLFYGKIECFRSNSSFILRYRAFLDKLMGLLILYYSPMEYEKFNKSKSRRKAFQKIIEEVTDVPSEFTKNIISHIDKFDSEFRTAEAHGTGSLRKISFSAIPLIEDPTVRLLTAYNMIIGFIDLLNDLFDQK